MSHSVVLGLGLGFGAAVYLVLAAYVWMHRRASGGRGLVALLLANVAWSLFYAIELSTRTVAAAQIWSGLKFVGVVTLAPAFWAFATSYAGRRRPLGSRTFLLLAVEPVIVLTALAVPGGSDLIHTYQEAPHTRLAHAPVADSGPLFWPHAVYTYVVLLAAMATLVTRLVRIARPYRRQARALIVAVFTPMVGNVAFNVDPGLFAGIDPTPFLFSVTAVVLVWGFFRLHLLDLVPVARSLVVEQMLDGVLVLDAYGRIVDANPSGTTLLRRGRGDVVGRYAADLLPALGDLLGRNGEVARARGHTRLGGGSGPPVDLALSLTPLTDADGSRTGQLIVLTDVSEQVATQRRLASLLEEQTRLAGVLQAGLKPPELPTVPGLVLAARSLPSGRGGDVGGDFYDVHPAVAGEWAFVLGDVSGKGVQAAVVTSMVRYTVRTLSVQGWTPAQVLQQLNAAMLEPDDPERFCTVVYGRTGPLPSAGEPPVVREARGRPVGMRLWIALGGHPQPLLRRRDGSIAPVDVSGTALGLLPGVDIGETVVDLLPGDLLVLYTDGVIEARNGGEQFGEARLAWVVGATMDRLALVADVGPTELVDAVADAVVTAVTGFARDRDDVAVLVMAVG
ncbi:MAG: histidine kinase N-terminal 7TM domain-containing protein [Kineosporiaceae bacterium]|jgi:serine phosphatase RsbU (regulator of sigma subunit)/PAS domain-containing protein